MKFKLMAQARGVGMETVSGKKAKRLPKPWTVVEERRAEELYKTMSAREVAGLGGEG